MDSPKMDSSEMDSPKMNRPKKKVTILDDSFLQTIEENGYDSAAEEKNNWPYAMQTTRKKRRSTPWNLGCKAWCKKYFLEGQSLTDDKEKELADLELDEDASWGEKFVARHRRAIGVIVPCSIYQFGWWMIMIRYNLWYLFETRYYLTIIMIIGSMIAGATSEGGGAVAFPVMTLFFHVSPSVARDVAFMIQGSGMTCATFTIFFMGVQVEWNSLIFCSLGGVAGNLLGLEFVDPILPPGVKKMVFVGTWFAFAFSLGILNCRRSRVTFKTIPEFKVWKAVVLVIAGFIGGMFTSFTGSGLDICSFSTLTLLFRISEKVATPTSVVLMATNSLIGLYWRSIMLNAVTMDAWYYIAICGQIVVVGAPIGAMLGSHLHRQVLASFVYILDTISLISAFILVPQTPFLIGLTCGIIVFGFLFFLGYTKLGEILMNRLPPDITEKHLIVKPPVAARRMSVVAGGAYAARRMSMMVGTTIAARRMSTMVTEADLAHLAKRFSGKHNKAYEAESFDIRL